MKFDPDPDTTVAESPELRADFPPNSYEEWRRAAESLLKGAPFEKVLHSRTYEGIELRPIFNPEDTRDLPHLGEMPGFSGYSRGYRARGYLDHPWEISQELPCSTPEEFNQTALGELERGQSELNVLVDLATQNGRDPDDAHIGEVGGCGVSLATLADMETAFSGINLPMISIYLRTGAFALPMTALFLAYARRRGIDYAAIRGCIEIDPLGTLAWRGNLPVSLNLAYRDMVAVTRFAEERARGLQTITVQGHPYHDGGGSAVQELACVIATGAEYIREMLKRGLTIESIGARMRFSLSVGSQFFMEVAKLRAVRLLWSQVIESFGGSPQDARLHIHCRTSIHNKTLHDPFVNLLRTTTEAFSAVIGGTDGMHVGAFDETFRVPDHFSRRLARNIQVILAEECDLSKVTDPAGGSWYVEWLTDQVARKAWSEFQEIERVGGMARALREGIPQKAIARTAAARAEAVARRRDVLVGTNLYPDAQARPLDLKLPDYAAIHRRRSREVENYRTSGSANNHTSVLSRLNILLESKPSHALNAAIDAVLNGATAGEISRTIRAGDEDHPSAPRVRMHRLAQGYERLRDVCATHREKHGHAPKVFQANIGPSRTYRARADWTTGFFQSGGFEVIADRDFTTPEEATRAAVESGARIVVITSVDDTYAETVPVLVPSIKRAIDRATVLVAGSPGENGERWATIGVDDYINVKVNNQAMLEQLLIKLGVLA
ncbi:MAG: methylmalonyl-CoA mutase family protein [Opitutaceae bacterium]